ncbi:MAG: MFS transporter [Anaerolineae bacterium]|nr:MFS transporter [Anaerolineae bacterium]
MPEETVISPWRVLIPVGLGTSLSLIGDASLYVVLPTHVTEAGVSLASVGILLSANRFIRLLFNGPAGMAYDRWSRRYLFIAALVIGAVSTALYALTQGFWPLLAGRLLWGLAWSGIWVGGNVIVLDLAGENNRGRWVGLYQISFFLGSSSGTMIGGLLTDWLGYHTAMGVGASLTLLGAMIALIFLPETRHFRRAVSVNWSKVSPPAANIVKPVNRSQLASAFALLGMSRLVVAGFLLSTFGLFLLEQFGDSIYVAGRLFGVATLTGVGLGLTTLMAMAAAPVMGRLSDRLHNRWPVAVGGLAPGVAGFGLLALGLPLTVLLGLPLTAITSGSNQGLATALVGDLSEAKQHGRRLGMLFTTGDLASAIGPPLAYGLIPLFGLSGIYLLSAGLYALMFWVAWQWAVRLGKKKRYGYEG